MQPKYQPGEQSEALIVVFMLVNVGHRSLELKHRVSSTDFPQRCKYSFGAILFLRGRVMQLD